jgi:cob(I)alamin adenosyltransferase
MSPFYTRSGDEGYTGLLGKGRYPKYDPRLETIGTIDELASVLGFARSSCKSEEVRNIILHVQKQLNGIMTEVAVTGEALDKIQKLEQDSVTWLEAQTDMLIEKAGKPKGFIIPGDSLPEAAVDMARTVTRRAERRLAELVHQGAVTNKEVLRYMNRLSSLCYAMELFENKLAGHSSPTMARDY